MLDLVRSNDQVSLAEIFVQSCDEAERRIPDDRSGELYGRGGIGRCETWIFVSDEGKNRSGSRRSEIWLFGQDWGRGIGGGKICC